MLEPRLALRGPVPLQTAVAATGDGTVLQMSGVDGAATTCVCQVSGTFTATITWEVSNDNALWYGILFAPPLSGTGALTATVPGLYRATVTGLLYLRARVTWTSGTSVTVKAWLV